MMRTAAILALLAAQDSGVDIPFERISKKGMSSRGPAVEKVIRDAKDWKAFWAHSSANQVLPAPDVDFAREAVLAVVDPLKPSSGYSVEITRTPDAVVVRLKRGVPPKGQGQLAVMTEPSCLVRAKLPPRLPVRFVEEPP